MAFIAGVCIPVWQEQLWSGVVIALVAAVAFLIFVCWPRLAMLGAFGLGFAWATFIGGQVLQQRLPAGLAGEDIAVSGTVYGLPQADKFPPRFELFPDRESSRKLGSTGRLRLSWYTDKLALRPGQKFTGTVRLRSPRGVLNPGGFDFERYAFEQRLAATGYVRDGIISEPQQLSFINRVDRIRLAVSDWIDRHINDPAHVALLQALAVGDQRALQDREWNTLRITGTGHLIAISGMHVGLVAAFGALLFAGIYRLFPRLALRLPRMILAALGALFFALTYALLAGWSLPVQRTLVMIAVVLLARVLKRNVAMPDSLALAAVAVLLFDPLAVLGAGFWLSFLGVAGLMWCLPGKHIEIALWKSFGRAQLAMSLGLLPVAIAFFGQGSVVGPLANLIAVPWITFVIIPLLLISVLLSVILPAAGILLIQLAATLLKPMWILMTWLASAPGAALFFAEPSAMAIALALIGTLWFFMPNVVPGRTLGLMLFLPLLLPRKDVIAHGDARLSMIDVGQGMAVLVRTESHNLLFDSGGKFRSGFNFGEAAVVPSLHALGVTHVDRLILSNLDADHAGGREAVLRAFPLAKVSIGIEADPAPRCLRGEHWQWDGVRFEFLHPPEFFPDRGNDSSCVLRVETDRSSALLTGDITEIIETRLIREAPEKIRADIVFAPHHGSRSSSSEAFVSATQAKLVLVSAGFDNRFGHPHPEVLTRWRDAKARIIESSTSGFVSLNMSDLEKIAEYRHSRHRYWQPVFAGDDPSTP